jgi:hypothetical protein
MNWRLLTAINAAIALITVSAVIYLVTRSPRTTGARRESARTSVQSKAVGNQPEERAEKKITIESPEDLTNARVDDLGAVPAVELTEIMRRATADQLMAMALKFNDAPTDARTFGGMAVFFQAWTELDPQAALTGAFRVNDVAMRRLAARTVVGSVSPSAASQLLAFVTEHPDKDLSAECKSEFLQTLVSSWSLLEPDAASKFMDDLGHSKNDYDSASNARSDVAYNWGTLDPSSALDWVAKQAGKDFIDSDNLNNSVIRGWCRRDISSAAAYVVQRLDEPAGAQMASSVVTAMFDHNVEDATNWISQMPTGDPRNQAESTIAQMWAEKDPAAASKWVGALPANEQANVASTIARSWVDSNWPEASRWIDTLSGDAHDSAISAAMHREGASPQESLSLAQSISDSDFRANEMDNVIRRWAVTDPKAAEIWVKGSALPPEQQAKLLSTITDTQNIATETDGGAVTVEH